MMKYAVEARARKKQYADDCERLQPKIEAIARQVLQRINAEIPISEGSVKYARQHALETVIGILQGAV